MFPDAAIEAAPRLSSVKASSRRLEILVAHILFRLALPQEAHLRHLPSGQPIAEGVDAHVSISHSHSYVALAVSDRPIGIDLEAWSPRALRIADKFLTPEEMPLLGIERERNAVRLWAAKEAAFKLWDESDTTVHEDIRLEQLEGGTLRAFHTKNPRLCADIFFSETESSEDESGAFALAQFPFS